jgi:hypothetical protein
MKAFDFLFFIVYSFMSRIPRKEDHDNIKSSCDLLFLAICTNLIVALFFINKFMIPNFKFLTNAVGSVTILLLLSSVIFILLRIYFIKHKNAERLINNYRLKERGGVKFTIYGLAYILITFLSINLLRLV